MTPIGSPVLRAVAFGAFLTGIAAAQVGIPELKLSDVEAKNLGSYADMVRGDLRKDKRAVIGDSIGLDGASQDKFWPVYDRYEKELKALWDVRLANTRKYAASRESMSDASVDAMAREFLRNDARMSALRAKYYGELKAAVGPKLATRFLHVESVLDRVIELQVLAIVPLVP